MTIKLKKEEIEKGWSLNEHGEAFKSFGSVITSDSDYRPDEYIEDFSTLYVSVRCDKFSKIYNVYETTKLDKKRKGVLCTRYRNEAFNEKHLSRRWSMNRFEDSFNEESLCQFWAGRYEIKT